jgi:hypothetical protein
MRTLGRLLGVCLVILSRWAVSVYAQTRSCPPGFNDTPAMPVHFEQASVLKMSLGQIFDTEQRIFVTDFNACDGAERYNRHRAPRTPDTVLRPRFTRVSAPDSNSCAGCHNQPQPGGAGDFVANVFVLAQAADPVFKIILNEDFSNRWLERNTLGMFGSGPIEMLGGEMTADLQSESQNAFARAHSSGHNVTIALVSKQVSFGKLTAPPDGSLDSSTVAGVDPDLIIKPFSCKGVFRSLREFTVTAMNQHHGMQAQERFGIGSDPDQDGVTDELTVGDITAVTVFQAALPVLQVSTTGFDPRVVAHGSELFNQIGCASCHIPSLALNKSKFCDPDPMNLPNTFNHTSQSYCFDLHQIGLNGNVVVAYTDLKRHVICDNNKPHYCNEPVSPVQASDSNFAIPLDQFLTAKLWDAGNSSPYGHRGDLDTIFAAIINHGGEATPAESQFEALPDSDQAAIVRFIHTLDMPILPAQKDQDVNMSNSPPANDQTSGNAQ